MQKTYTSNDGFKFLEKGKSLLKAKKGHLSQADVKKILDSARLAAQLLVHYSYYQAESHRIMGEVMEETGDIHGAIENYTEALKLNPKVGVKQRLGKLDPGNQEAAIRISKTSPRPLFRTTSSDLCKIEFTGQHEGVPSGQAPRGSYYAVKDFGYFCAYAKNKYEHTLENTSYTEIPTGETTISFTKSNGAWLGQRDLDHLVYQFDCGENPETIATLSFDLKLRLYRSGVAVPVVKNIAATQRYEISGLAVNADGTRVYYAIGDKLFVLDKDLNQVEKGMQQIRNTIDYRNTITAFCLSMSQRTIYLGHYSGLLTRTTDLKNEQTVFKADAGIRRIKEINEYLILIVQSGLIVLKNEALATTINLPNPYIPSIKFFPEANLVVVHNSNRLTFYALPGHLIGEIEMRDGIADFYYQSSAILVYAAETVYRFHLLLEIKGETNLPGGQPAERMTNDRNLVNLPDARL